MFFQTSPAFLYEPALASRVLKLIFGRLILVILIVLGGWWLGPGGSEVSLNIAPQGSKLFLPVTVALTGAYLLWLRFGRTLLRQVRVQFLVDTILVTWIVWETGDLISPYITLYTILIGLAGFFLGKADAIAVAGACAFCFTVLPFVINPTLIDSFSGEASPSRAVQTIAFNDVAFLLVGLLAGRLADRRRIGDALKQAEANFANLNVLHERILDSINSGIITTNLDGKIYSFNRAAEEITGIKPYHTLAKNIFSIFSDEIREPVESCLKGGPLDAPSFTKFEAKLRPAAPGNEEVVVSCSVQPLLSASGIKTGLIFAFEDMTELRALEETVRRSDRLAAVGRLAAGLAHEIRNPLGSMSSALQFLSAKAAKDDDAALMEVVLRESERVNTIITDFLAYARPGENKNDGEAVMQVDVGIAIGDCLALFRHDPAVSDRHIFEFEPPDPPIILFITESLIKQIIWNLVGNSIKSMPEGGRLSVGLSVPYPARVMITVSDTGHGIAPDDIDKIFEPFHSGGGGSGLGLSIVHRIVTEVGGRIDAKSEAGKGTTITIYLPKR